MSKTKKIASNIYKSNKVSISKLRWKCPDSKFNFKSTETLKPLETIVGQPRAIESIKIGAELFATGYNIFVTGMSGTGRLTTVRSILKDVTTTRPQLFDFCYVNNFTHQEKPTLLRLQRGKGRILSSMMDDTIQLLRMQLPKFFEDEGFQEKRKKIIESYQKQENEHLKKFDDKIKPFDFVRGNLEAEDGTSQPEVFPVVDGKPIQIAAIDELLSKGMIKKADAKKFKDHYKKFRDELFQLVRQGMKMMQALRKDLVEFNKKSAMTILNSAFEELLVEFPFKKVEKYIHDVKQHIIENLSLFVPGQNDYVSEDDEDNKQINTAKFDIYTINVILDNTYNTEAPVVIERNPTYSNLFGSKERVYDQRGFWRTDFTKVKAGSLLQADQGYLIVNADDLFNEPGVWISLKRVLLYNKLEIQPVDTYYQVSQSHLKPEAIDVNVKVIIIGGRTLYNALYNYEKGFKKIFKINAQFDYETAKTDAMLSYYARFAAKVCFNENLPHVAPDGMAAISEWASEQAGSQNLISLKFSDIADLIRESAFYKDKNTKRIKRSDVIRAINYRRRRHDLVDNKMSRNIKEGIILIDTEGVRVGQINGLTVMSDGIISFGKPARITAVVSAGTAGIINVEREANMSGDIHNKGVLIITSFFRELFAQKHLLSFTASLTFEQSYGGIDGDSASAAEIYVIMSAISGLPINQSLAITGSVNQKGDIQPIGGVNDKIRGFFEVCKNRGLTGSQGVVIPKQNVKDLMICQEIVDAVKENNFHIYSISNINEGVEIMLGVKPGNLRADGTYTANSVYRKVADKLQELNIIANCKKNKKKN